MVGSIPTRGANLLIKVYFCGSLLEGEATALVAVVGSNPATGANSRVCDRLRNAHSSVIGRPQTGEMGAETLDAYGKVSGLK